ncbi:hypothetical protein L1D50_18435, partial [Pseudoalteromonas sp. Isolate6]|uniref:hypothetical protein n=1 Tax=Pseudoalteromonas sp. Isolate6 TaxID=2908527 RepID=UPI001EFD4120
LKFGLNFKQSRDLSLLKETIISIKSNTKTYCDKRYQNWVLGVLDFHEKEIEKLESLLGQRLDFLNREIQYKNILFHRWYSKVIFALVAIQVILAFYSAEIDWSFITEHLN